MTLPSFFNPPAGGGAAGVGEGLGGGDEHGLLEVAFRHGDATPVKELPQFLFERRVRVELLAHELGDGLSGYVVLRGAEAARRDNNVRAVPGLLKDAGESVLVVADGGDAVVADADCGELGGEVVGVGIGERAEQDLRADGDDLSAQHFNIVCGHWRDALLRLLTVGSYTLTVTITTLREL